MLHNSCLNHEIESYPDWLTYKPPHYGSIALCSVLCCYFFIWMAILCDEYCIPAIEVICFKTLRMSYSVAGATFLAITTSAPEFFCSLYATFLTEGDLGLGTVIGSSVFNTLFICAVCAFKAGTVCLDWWPLSRDLIWYAFSLGLLTYFMYDYKIYWYEALVLVLLFIINMTTLALDDQLQKIRNPNRQCLCICFVPPGEVADFKRTLNGETEENENIEKENESEEDELFNFTMWPSSCIKRIWWIIIYPIHCILFITIPNVKRSWGSKCAILSLLMSIAWIAFISYLIGWVLTAIGFQLKLPESVMGLTILAVGTSVPEAITSYIITGKGYGSMAICNAISSNTFDMLFGLAVPWLIKSLICFKDGQCSFVTLETSDMANLAGALFLTILIVYVVFMIARFRLCIILGVAFTFGYIIYTTMAVIFEMKFPQRLPFCKDFSQF